MPIVELRASRESIDNGGGTHAATELCKSFKSGVLQGFDIPDEDDFETRITLLNGQPSVLYCDLTEGPNVYPKSKGREALNPTDEQVDKVGKEMQKQAGASGFKVGETQITVWPDTSYILQEGDEVKEPIETDELKRLSEEMRGRIVEAKIKLVVVPEVLVASSQKEAELSETLGRATREISNEIGKALGVSPEKMGSPKLEVTLAADTHYSLEMDNVTTGEKVPEELLQYTAEVALFELHNRFGTSTNEAEVWIRQNRPESKVFTS